MNGGVRGKEGKRECCGNTEGTLRQCKGVRGDLEGSLGRSEPNAGLILDMGTACVRSYNCPADWSIRGIMLRLGDSFKQLDSLLTVAR